MKRVELIQPGTGAVFEFAEDRVDDALSRGFTRPASKSAPGKAVNKRPQTVKRSKKK